jgi:hypothetical protein
VGREVSRGSGLAGLKFHALISFLGQSFCNFGSSRGYNPNYPKLYQVFEPGI